MVWIDGLDMHIVNLLGASFRESYPDKIFPTNRPTGSTQAIAGSNMLPEGYDRRSQISPLFSYPYRAARGQPTVTDLDGAERFSIKVHMRGEIGRASCRERGCQYV